jgi:hypothetical protein
MKTTLFATLGLSALIAGCSSYERPQTESISQAIDLDRLDTFAVSVAAADDADTAFGPTAQEEAREALVEGLERQGFDMTADRDDADFIANFYTAIKSDSEVFAQTYGNPSQSVVTTEQRVVTPTGQSVPIERRDTVVTTYRADPITLDDDDRIYVLDIVDNETEMLLWRGYIATDDTEITRDGEVEEYVERIIASLPNT